MDFQGKLQQFAELIVKLGVNLQPGEELSVKTPIECVSLARLIAAEAYKAGAKDVSVDFMDDEITKLRYENVATDVMCAIPQWLIDKSNYQVDRKVNRVSIYSTDPELLSAIEPEKIAKFAAASSKAMKRMREATSKNEVKWCVVSAPSAAWAKKLFPDDTDEVACDKLWNYIFTTMRMDEKDPVAAWHEHQDRLAARCDFLNEKQFKEFRYFTNSGTNLTVGMPENHRFLGGSEKSQAGCEFTANMPTEEVFSAPHREKVNGRLVSAMPLCVDGKLVEDFYIDFKDGRVCGYDAKSGAEVLKGIVETDEGSAYLGEIALVGYTNPIRGLNTLFYNTLFDENASCHFAFGSAYANCVEGGAAMSTEELLKRGINDSMRHEDFMIGTRDLRVVGIDADGNETAIIENGDFVI